MQDVLINIAGEIILEVALAVIALFFAWLTAKLGKYASVKTTNAALDGLRTATEETVMELMQTVVTDAKATAADHKLTADEIKDLNEKVVEITLKKMASPTITLLQAAEVDVIAKIQSCAEAAVINYKADKAEVTENE